MGHKSSKPRKLSEDHINSLINTTRLSRDEIDQWYKGFVVTENKISYNYYSII